MLSKWKNFQKHRLFKYSLSSLYRRTRLWSDQAIDLHRSSDCSENWKHESLAPGEARRRDLVWPTFAPSSWYCHFCDVDGSAGDVVQSVRVCMNVPSDEAPRWDYVQRLLVRRLSKNQRFDWRRRGRGAQRREDAKNSACGSFFASAVFCPGLNYVNYSIYLQLIGFFFISMVSNQEGGTTSEYRFLALRNIQSSPSKLCPVTGCIKERTGLTSFFETQQGKREQM